MDSKNWLYILFVLNCVLASFALVKNHSTTVNVLAAVFTPFITTDLNHKFANGIDVQIVKAITKRLDLKLNLVRTNSISQMTATQLEKYDVVIGGIRPDYFPNHTSFVASAPYMQDDLTWCVSQAKAIPRWKNVYYISKGALTQTWGAVMFIITIFGPFLFTTFEERPVDFWYSAILAFQTLITFSSTFNPKRSILRFHFALFLVISFWLMQIFSSFLILYSQRIFYENQISTIDEIVSNGFRLAGDPYTLNHLKVSNVEQLNNFEVCNDIDKCLLRLEFDDKLAVATSRLHVQAIPLKRNIFCFDPEQNIYNYLNTFMLRDDFPMKREFDDMLERIVISGLLSKWKKDMRLFHHVTILFISEGGKLADFSYVFMVFVGVILSTFTLMAEIFIYKKANSVNATKFWKFCDKFICGKRYFFLLEPRNDSVIIPFTK